MSFNKRFVIKKDERTDVITYMEYEKREGFTVKPKKNISFEDMINVSEMIIVNPSLIEKLILKKCNKSLIKIMNMLSIVSEDDDDDTGYAIVLDEISRLQSLLNNKYKKYLEEKDYELMEKKVLLIKQEVEIRRQRALDFEYETNKKGKSSR